MNTPLYIARRYLIAKKGNTAVTFITWLAAFAMMAAVASMFVILSVFSGLEDLNKQMIENIHSDLSISSKNGKTLKNIDKIENILSENSSIKAYSRVIEEKVYINYNGVGEIAYLRGVDSMYTQVNPIDKRILIGKYPSFQFVNEVLVEVGLDTRLSIPIDTEEDFAWIFMPKSGTGIISKEEDIFSKKEIYVTGVFTPDSEQLSNYILAPIELSQELLNLPKKTAYQIVIRLNNPNEANLVRGVLEKSLGKEDYAIKTKEEENAAFWKMINTEKLMIYLIFSLVIFITTFNLAGAIIILQLDKRQQAKSLISLGMSKKSLRKIYFYTGLLIVLFGIIIGLFIGTLLAALQINTGAFQTNGMPFPIKITMENYFIVTSITLFLGVLVSWFFSRTDKYSSV